MKENTSGRGKKGNQREFELSTTTKRGSSR